MIDDMKFRASLLLFNIAHLNREATNGGPWITTLAGISSSRSSVRFLCCMCSTTTDLTDEQAVIAIEIANDRRHEVPSKSASVQYCSLESGSYERRPLDHDTGRDLKLTLVGTIPVL